MSGGDGPQFVDTNVLIYAHDVSARAKNARAAALMTEGMAKTRPGPLMLPEQEPRPQGS